jgi:sugar lactone lactonase YvrE
MKQLARVVRSVVKIDSVFLKTGLRLMVLLALACGLPAVAQVQLVPTATNITFPTTAIGASAPVQNVYVKTTATETITSITVPPSIGGKQEYVVGAITGCTIGASNPSGTTCTVPITFTPAYPGSRQLPLQVVTSTGNVNFGLLGIGTGPEAALMPGVITTVAGNGHLGYSGDNGAATSAEIFSPGSSYVDSSGNLYISDTYNHRIRKVDVNGIITTVAGGGTSPLTCTGSKNSIGDGCLATNAVLCMPAEITMDGASNLFFADSCNKRIRKIDFNGIITTVAGNGTQGFTGDSGPATSAELSEPIGLAMDSAGNLYFVDAPNRRLRKVSTSGIITTVAGGGTSPATCTGSTNSIGDGCIATSAVFEEPGWVALDSFGNLYITDSGSNLIRKVGTNGIITTVVGNGIAGFSGDHGPATSAEIYSPDDLAIDTAGNIYFADYASQRIRMVNTSGIISTVAGGGNGPYNTTYIGSATSAQFGYPVGLSLDAAGNFYIAVPGDDSIRKVTVNQSALNYATTTNVGTQDTTDGAQNVSIYNTGNAPLSLTVPTTGTNPSIASGFAYDAASTCPQLNTGSSAYSLAAGASCTYAVDFIPTAEGTNSGSLILTNNSLNQTGTTLTVPLSGSGKGGLASTTTLTTSATNVVPNQAVTLTATVAGSGVTPTGTVTFSSTSTGLNQGVLGTATLVNGVATYYGLVWVGVDSITASYSGDANYSASTSNAVAVTNAPVSGKIVFNWPYLDWAQPVAYGASTTPWPVTLTNLTGSSIASPILSLSGGIAANLQFSGNTCGTLAQGASCTFSVSFAPTSGGSPTGTKQTGTLTATASGYTATLPVSGVAQSSALSFNWPFLNFTPTVSVGSTAPAWPVTMTNQSGTTTTVDSINLSDASFTLTNDNCTGQTLAAGAGCNFSVLFSPILADITQGGTNVITGTLTASGNSGAVTGTLTVGGWGGAGGLSINWNQDQQAGVSTIDFGPNNTSNVTSGPWPIIVYNNTPTAETLTLAPSLGVFTTGQSNCTSVPAGASCVFNLYFTPTAVQHYKGTLTITGDVSGSYIFNTWGEAIR